MPAPGGRNGADSPVKYKQPSEWPTAILWFGSIAAFILSQVLLPEEWAFRAVLIVFGIHFLASILMNF